MKQANKKKAGGQLGNPGGQKGRSGPPGNNNAIVTHGAYKKLQRVDGRTAEGKIIQHIEAELATALGAPSPMEILLIQRVAVKALKIHLAERHFLGKNGNTARLEKDYLSWTNSLRADLQLLGLQRRQKPIKDIGTYLKDNYAQ